jgi:hypothetical protein
MTSFTVLHWPWLSTPPGSGGTSALPAPPRHALLFETCQRRLAISLVPGLDDLPDAEIFRDVAGYAFLLEVVCGLRSRLFGETEVQGQFRLFCRNHPSLAPWDRWLLEDAKAIRARILGDPGAHSYAGVVRQWCGTRRSVTVLGTGQLATSLQQQVPHARLVPSRGLSGVPSSEIVVIAAPVDTSKLHILRATTPASTTWIDLRHDRGDFRAERTLDDVYAALERASDERRKRMPAAQEAIRQRSQTRFATPWCRPWGWEDVAA